MLVSSLFFFFFFFSSRRRHTRLQGDWSSDVCSSDLNDAGSLSIGLCKIVIDISAANQAGDHLTSQKCIVWRQCAEDVGIHNIHQPIPARLRIPVNQVVTDGQVKDWVSDSDDAYQLSVVFVPDKVSKSPAEAI